MTCDEVWRIIRSESPLGHSRDIRTRMREHVQACLPCADKLRAIANPLSPGYRRGQILARLDDLAQIAEGN